MALEYVALRWLNRERPNLLPDLTLSLKCYLCHECFGVTHHQSTFLAARSLWLW